ncbi:class I SAM-dependent methyltransferase [Gordonia zhaorongruii]|uniref:class I SAM-dependent methyltransferase n=1 Tax=Gordonia zhaorongruii TaxID=2597659 RepID=UPI00104F39EF|nr:class I SAM-dependent methyltransferase [Gordonia zhaorongruii]
MRDYWNHSTAYHPELVASASGRRQVLDVGCGDGLLLQKLGDGATHLTGIDPDASAVALATTRLSTHPGVQLIVGDFLTDSSLQAAHYDLITCVAALHHMPLVPALERMRDLVAPGGSLRVVGLAANKSITDWVVAGTTVLPIRALSTVHGESSYPDMTTASPVESLAEIRDAAALVLPGSRVQRRFYYRYTLAWTKPVVARTSSDHRG